MYRMTVHVDQIMDQWVLSGHVSESDGFGVWLSLASFGRTFVLGEVPPSHDPVVTMLGVLRQWSEETIGD